MFTRSFFFVLVLCGMLVFNGCGNPKTAIDSPLPEGAYKAEIFIENSPTSIKAGSKTKIMVKVKNISNTLWPFQGQPDGKFRINLGDHWLDKHGNIIVWDSSRASLPHDVKAGSEVTIEINMVAPSTPGDYILEYDMVQEMITWFKDKGSKTANVNIKVE